MFDAPANRGIYDEPFVGPPLHAKTNPRPELRQAALTLDDEHRVSHHHPNDNAVTEFEFEPDAADAAADLAGELGSQFLEGATRAEDLSERVIEVEEDEEASDLPYMIEETGPRDVVIPPGGDEDVDEEAPTKPIRRRPR